MSEKKWRILIVEDDNFLREAMNEKLSKEGFNSFVAINGKEGLEMALQKHPDLILLDIMMPVMDGIEMLKKLREDNWGKNVLVAMLSNSDDESKIKEALEMGAVDYMIKSDILLEDVIKKIMSYLK